MYNTQVSVFFWEKTVSIEIGISRHLSSSDFFYSFLHKIDVYQILEQGQGNIL